MEAGLGIIYYLDSLGMIIQPRFFSPTPLESGVRKCSLLLFVYLHTQCMCVLCASPSAHQHLVSPVTPKCALTVVCEAHRATHPEALRGTRGAFLPRRKVGKERERELEEHPQTFCSGVSCGNRIHNNAQSRSSHCWRDKIHTETHNDMSRLR